MVSAASNRHYFTSIIKNKKIISCQDVTTLFVSDCEAETLWWVNYHKYCFVSRIFHKRWSTFNFTSAFGELLFSWTAFNCLPTPPPPIRMCHSATYSLDVATEVRNVSWKHIILVFNADYGSEVSLETFQCHLKVTLLIFSWEQSLQANKNNWFQNKLQTNPLIASIVYGHGQHMSKHSRYLFKIIAYACSENNQSRNSFGGVFGSEQEHCCYLGLKNLYIYSSLDQNQINV